MALTVAQLVARLTADTSGFYRGMAIANSAMLRSGGLITRVAAGAGLATLGMGILSLRAAGNFQESQNILQAVSGATTKQMEALRKEAIALGADFKLPNVSAKDASEAMQALARGGLSVQQTLEATRGTLQLGLAANIGFADSATIVARSLKAFNLGGAEATRVADLFTAAANKSTAEMTDIALGFQMASAQFAAGDQTIQGLTTSLTLMANAGIVGSDAGTSLKTMMNRLMAPTQKARDLMKDLGIQVYDSSGNMKSMPNIIQELNTAMGGMSKEQRNAALYTLFGSDAIRAARVQMNAGRKGWLQMQEAITQGGEAQRFAEARTKGFNGALQAFGSAVETLAITLGTALLPAATDIVRALTNFINTIDPAKIIGFFSAITGGISIIYNFISGSDLLTAALGGLLAMFISYRAVMAGWTAIMNIATVAMGVFNAVTAANPIVLIIAAIIGLAAALVILWKRSETFRAIVTGVWEAVKTAALTAINFIRNHWMLLVGILTGGVGMLAYLIISKWDAIKNATMAIWGAISGFFKKWWPLLFIIFALPLALIFAVVNRTWRRIWAITQTVWNAVKSVVTTVIGAIKGAVSAVLGPIVGIVSRIFNAAKERILAPMRAAKGLLRTALEALGGVIRGVIGIITAAAMSIGSAIADGILSGLSGLAGALQDAVVGAAKSALGSAKKLLGIGSPSKLFRDEVGAPIVEGAVQGILNEARALRSAVSHAFDVVPEPTAYPARSYAGLAPAIASGMAGGPQVIQNFHVHGAILDEGKLLRVMRQAGDRWGRQNSGRDPLGGYS